MRVLGVMVDDKGSTAAMVRFRLRQAAVMLARLRGALRSRRRSAYVDPRQQRPLRSRAVESQLDSRARAFRRRDELALQHRGDVQGGRQWTETQAGWISSCRRRREAALAVRAAVAGLNSLLAQACGASHGWRGQLARHAG